MKFSDLITEVRRRTLTDSGGATFETQAKRWLNLAQQHIRGEALWKILRLKRTFSTVGNYTTGTIDAITNGATTVNGTDTLWVTGGIIPGRRIKINDDTQSRVIATVTAEGTLTLESGYGGTTSSTGSLTYTILGEEEYRLPFDWGDIGIFWHEGFGYPFEMAPITDREFYDSVFSLDFSTRPEVYRLWGEDGVEAQPTSASVLTVSSSSAADTSQTVRIEGLVSSLPDFEDFTLNGTSDVVGSKSFSRVDRVVKSASTTGRIIVTSNSANITIVTLPAGDILRTMSFYRIQLWPIPDDVYVINVQTYDRLKDLVDDNDVSALGQEFDEALILWSTYIGRKYDQDIPAATQVRQDYFGEIRRLKAQNNRNADRIFRFQERGEFTTTSARGRKPFLRFGSFFPTVFR